MWFVNSFVEARFPIEWTMFKCSPPKWALLCSVVVAFRLRKDAGNLFGVDDGGRPASAAAVSSALASCAMLCFPFRLTGCAIS